MTCKHEFVDRALIMNSECVACLRGGSDKFSRLETEGDAAGCYPCDTCSGFRAVGSSCLWCLGRANALAAEVEKLKKVVAECGVALEVLNGSDQQKRIEEIGPELRALLWHALMQIRAALSDSARPMEAPAEDAAKKGGG